MDYLKPNKFINVEEYDYVVSIGNKCPTAMILRDLNIYKDAFPFDYIPTTPTLILKYLQDQTDFYPTKNVIRTADDVWFGHFNINDEYDKTIQTFNRRFRLLFNILQNKKRILFVYTSEADVYNEMNNRYNDNYNDLSQIVNYITETYKYDNFTILSIHTNKSFSDTKNIINYTINVPDNFLSDDMSSHTDNTTSNYRHVLKNLIKEIFKI
jgi:hypothetical protein